MFHSWSAAERSIRNIKRYGKVKNSGTPCRVYQCEHCVKYHVTSQGEWDQWWEED